MMSRRSQVLRGVLNAAALAVAAMGGVTAQAGSPAVSIEAPARNRPTGINDICGPQDRDCRRTILMALISEHVRPITVGQGVTFSSQGAGKAVRFGTRFLQLEKPSGDASLIIFDAAYLSEGGFRVRFTLADAEALFTCTGEEGNTIQMGLSLIKGCKAVDGGARAIVGAGGKLVQVQWDQITNRIAARWLELYGVINLLANANEKNYLKQRLQIYGGANLDTIRYADTPDTSGGSSTMPKYTFGITGMIRPDSNHWEVTGLAGFRQSLTDSSDYSFESRAQALYNILYTREKLMHLGVDAQYQFNSIPAHSMGELVSDRERHSAYLGAVLGFKFD